MIETINIIYLQPKTSIKSLLISPRIFLFEHFRATIHSSLKQKQGTLGANKKNKLAKNITHDSFLPLAQFRCSPFTMAMVGEISLNKSFEFQDLSERMLPRNLMKSSGSCLFAYERSWFGCRSNLTHNFGANVNLLVVKFIQLHYMQL